MDRLKPPLPYRPDYEHPHEDEAEAIDKLREVFVGMAKTVADDTGHALRAVHAKAHAVLRARLHVAALPPELSARAVRRADQLRRAGAAVLATC